MKFRERDPEKSNLPKPKPRMSERKSNVCVSLPVSILDQLDESVRNMHFESRSQALAWSVNFAFNNSDELPIRFKGSTTEEQFDARVRDYVVRCAKRGIWFDRNGPEVPERCRLSVGSENYMGAKDYLFYVKYPFYIYQIYLEMYGTNRPTENPDGTWNLPEPRS